MALKKNKSGINHPEAAAQEAFFAWAAIDKSIPYLNLLYAIQNAQNRPWSETSKKIGINLAAARAKKQGVKKGVWDVNFPVPRGKYSSLWIEFKHGKNKLTKEQEEFREYLKEWCKFEVCYDWTSARLAVLKYWFERIL